MFRGSPYLSSILFWLFLSAVALIALQIWLDLRWIFDILIAMNASAFVLYGFDKFQAVSRSRRIPEKVLWLAAFAGGPAGALAGMYAFRHKTSKISFQFILFILILLQIALILYFHESLLEFFSSMKKTEGAIFGQ